MGGVEIALKAMLGAVGITAVELGGEPPEGAEVIAATECAETGLALGVFKAAQLLEMDELDEAFGDFTAIDLETTDDDTTKAEIVEIAAVRVRGGRDRRHVRGRREAARPDRARRDADARLERRRRRERAVLRGGLAALPRVLRRGRHRRAQRVRFRLPHSPAHGPRASVRTNDSACTRTTRCRSRATSFRRAASSSTWRGSSASPPGVRTTRSTTRERSPASCSRSTARRAVARARRRS